MSTGAQLQGDAIPAKPDTIDPSTRRNAMMDPKDYMAKAKQQMDAWSAEMSKMQGQMMKAGKDAQDQMM